MSAEKLLVMQVAAQLAAPVIGNLPDTLTLDKDIKSADVQVENLMEWEVFRIFYHATVKALADDVNWPAPAVNTAGLLPNINLPAVLQAALPALAGAVGGPGGAALVAALQPLLSQLTNPGKPVATGTLPAPGDVTPGVVK